MDIEVFRPKQFFDMTRNYKLFADGKEVATIKRGSTQIVSLPENTTSLHAQIDWCSSLSINVSELDTPQITIMNSFSGNVWKALFLPSYYMSVGKGNYLSIRSSL